MSEYALELRDIVKAFPGIVACDHVDLRVRRGSIHALVGENGAGKTTLMRVAYGETRPDSGDVKIESEAMGRGGTARAIELGLGMVHQHFMLVPTLTVAENVSLGSEPHHGAWLDREMMAQQVQDAAQVLGFRIDPTAKAGDLSVGEQQRIEILRALARPALHAARLVFSHPVDRRRME
jgi:simple sugar transport system ATP-binding protein